MYNVHIKHRNCKETSQDFIWYHIVWIPLFIKDSREWGEVFLKVSIDGRWMAVSLTNPLLLSRNEEALTCGNLVGVLRKTVPTSPKAAFIQLDLPSSSDRPLALYSSAVSESAWGGGIHKENLMQSRLIYFVGSASILFTMLCSPHLAFVIFEPLPSSLFLSIPQVNQEILSLFFVFKMKQNE